MNLRLRNVEDLRDLANRRALNQLDFNELEVGLGLLLLGMKKGSWVRSVLRIQRSENGEVVFALSGRMNSEHIAELEKLLKAEPTGRQVVLNLKDLTLVGQDAVDFLAHCEERGITLRHCAPYVREWINRQRRQQ